MSSTGSWVGAGVDHLRGVEQGSKVLAYQPLAGGKSTECEVQSGLRNLAVNVCQNEVEVGPNLAKGMLLKRAISFPARFTMDELKRRLMLSCPSITEENNLRRGGREPEIASIHWTQCNPTKLNISYQGASSTELYRIVSNRKEGANLPRANWLDRPIAAATGHVRATSSHHHHHFPPVVEPRLWNCPFALRVGAQLALGRYHV
jgi:hypothetical protein